MSETLALRAAALRASFDRAFAEPPAAPGGAEEDYLAIRLGTEPYAIPLAGVAGLFADRKVTKLPGAPAILLGVAGFRGTVVPVYDLGAILGGEAAAAPRWLAIAAETGAALAFTGFDGHHRVLRDAIVPADPATAARRLVRALLPADGLARPIIHLPSVFESVRLLVPDQGRGKER